MIGNTLGSYSIQRELGRGGMGAVYVGVHSLLGRTAAVKVLLPELSRNQDIVQRFFNEARAATAIKHPGIVEIYDFGWAQDGSAYIVMEYLEGESLAARLRRLGRLSPAAALGISRQVATALAAAHRGGIVHRDLKPDNVYLVPDAETSIGERVKLLDFGIAKLAGDTGGNMARTTTGAIMGTPYYMSPEQCKGAGQVDARSDLYSLGCMMFEMVVGRVPFVGEGGGEIIAAHIHVPAPAARSLAPDVPPELEALIARLMAKRPEDRPQSAEAAAQEIGDVAQRVGASIGTAMQPIAQAPMTTPAPYHATPAPGTPAPTTLGTASGQPSIAPSQAPPKKSRTAIWFALIVLLLGAATAAVLFATRGGGGEQRAAKDPPSPTDASAAVRIDARAAPAPDARALPADVDAGVPVATDAGPAVVIDGGAPIPSDHDKLVQAARDAATGGKWQRAAELARALLAIDPADADAKALADDYFAQHPFPKKKDCKDQKSAASEAARFWPGDPRAATMQKTAKACKDDKPESKPDAGVPDDNPDGTPTVQQLVQNAGDALKTGKYGQALRLCELALLDKPRNRKALSICAIASCNLKNRDKAEKYIGSLPRAMRDAPLQVCARQGIDLGKDDPY